MTLRAAILLTAGLVSAWAALEPAAWPAEARNAGPEAGWRGDGTGRYPNASPPTEWGRVAKSVKEMSAQARKPKNGETGSPMADGAIHEWLVLGPVLMPEGKTVSDELLPNEAELSPDEKEKAGDLAWKAVRVDGACLDFMDLLGREPRTVAPNAVAYAHAYLYSKRAQPIALNLMHRSLGKLWLNGKVAYAECKPGGNQASRLKLQLAQGWNRLLVKMASGGAANWYLRAAFYGAEGCEYETRNILWTTPAPASGLASPILVGDRIFVTSELCNLCCVNKADGKVLWVRSTTYADAATDEEKKAHPEVFQEIAPLSARLKEIDESFPGATPPSAKVRKEKEELEKQIHKLMRKVDRAKYTLQNGAEPGFAGKTPTSDGQRVFVAFATGATACFDLQGNRKWARIENYNDMEEHGFTSSPLLLGDILMTQMRGPIGLRADTGEVLWRQKEDKYWSSLIGVTLGGERLFITPYCDVSRASDGKVLCQGPSRPKGYFPDCIPSPVTENGLVYRIETFPFNDGPKGTTYVEILRLPGSAAEPFKPEVLKRFTIDLSRYPRFYQAWHIASPLCHEGLLYLVSDDGVLTVVDTAKGEVVYQKFLDLQPHMHHNFGVGRGGCGSSPTLAGRYIFFFGNQGTAIVMEPGRAFKQVAKNRVEYIIGPNEWWACQERMMSCPVFEGTRLYFRTEANLYCVGEAR